MDDGLGSGRGLSIWVGGTGWVVCAEGTEQGYLDWQAGGWKTNGMLMQ